MIDELTPEPVVETVFVAVPEERPFMGVSFSDYSVTEGLLLLIFLFVFLRFFFDLFRR